MLPKRSVVFLFDLLQDVNILRPLVRLAAERLDVDVLLLVSWKFMDRDAGGGWRVEIDALGSEVGAAVTAFTSENEAWRRLLGRRGAVVSASESSLGTHAVGHTIFCMAPPGLLRITVQHGFECVGFLHNAAHDQSHGRTVTFAADVVCGWCEAPALSALSASERSKLVVTGPPTLLQQPSLGQRGGDGPLVCENLHSVRLKANWTFRAGFIDTYLAFCDRLGAEGRTATLRPHPAGQFFAKNGVALPANVKLDGRPSYRVDFSSYSCGISAPSSVLVDMVLAGIPVAVWQDGGSRIDIGNYTGLAVVSDVEDWLAFEAQAREQPMLAAAAGRCFLDRSMLLTNAAEVERRFLTLLSGVAPLRTVPQSPADADAGAPASTRAPRRILFVVNAVIPTLEIYFTDPLAERAGQGAVEWKMVTEADMKQQFGSKLRTPEAWEAVRQAVDAFDPTIVVFCRYSGPHAAALIEHARACGVPTLLHLDDDLLNVPRELGPKKFAFHNHPARLSSVRHLLDHADMVFCSTATLQRSLQAGGFRAPIHVGPISVGMDIMRAAQLRPVRRIGYMGFDHELDFQIALPALVRHLRRHPEVTFELFGAIPRPPELDEFGDRVTLVEPVRGYGAFREAFAAREWDIGIAPLQDTPFNMRKSDLKWVEYTSVGTAFIGTAGTVYDRCAADGCALLVRTEEEWLAAFEELTTSPAARFEMVRRAQERLSRDYSLARMRQQVEDALTMAECLASRRAAVRPVHTGAGAEAPGSGPSAPGLVALSS